MKTRPLLKVILALSLSLPGCIPNWTPVTGLVDLPALPAVSRISQSGASTETAPDASHAAAQSLLLSLTLPHEWNYVMRGDDLLASRDGMFLQHIQVERIPIDQTDQSDGAFPQAAFSSKQWPVRTGRYLTGTLTPGMSPLDVAEAVLASRRNNEGVSAVEVLEMTPRTVAGHPGFRIVLQFHVAVPPNTPYAKPVPGMQRSTPYRSVCYGFMKGEWLYVIGYTATKRYYFERDAETFEDVMRGLAAR
jgi:hypothetical protein